MLDDSEGSSLSSAIKKQFHDRGEKHLGIIPNETTLIIPNNV